MSVIAKFKVTEKTVNESGEKITLKPVVSSNPNDENSRFFKYTPGGECVLQTVNPEAAGYFEVGKEYYLTFEKYQQRKETEHVIKPTPDTPRIKS